MKRVTIGLKTACVVALTLLIASCVSPEEKQRIRLASSAFDRALQASAKDSDARMSELQSAIDNVTDDDARDQLQRCQRQLATYLDSQRVSIDLEGEMRRNGRGTYTSNDLNKAFAKATSKEGVPDLPTINACSQNLRKLTE